MIAFDIEYINTIKLLAVAIAPGLAISMFIYYMDKFEKEPLHLLVKCFFLGALVIIPAIFLNKFFFSVVAPSQSVIGMASFAFLVIALSEELCKFAAVRFFAFPKVDFNEPYDGIVYSVMVAMGFATTENIMYVLVQDSFPDSLKVGVIRMFTAVPAHAAMGIMMGYFIGLAKFHRAKNVLMMTGFFAAMIFHGVYDLLLTMQNYPFMTAGAIVSLFISIQLSMKAINNSGKYSPYKDSPPFPNNNLGKF